MSGFTECAVCAAKTGCVVLCESCVANRTAIGRVDAIERENDTLGREVNRLLMALGRAHLKIESLQSTQPAK